MGDEEEEEAAAEFERHWRGEFPGEAAPALRLGSVPAMEEELGRCRQTLQRLQRALAEEKFKVIYLEAALARHADGELPPLPAPSSPSAFKARKPVAGPRLGERFVPTPQDSGGFRLLPRGDAPARRPPPPPRRWRRHRDRDLPDGCSSPEPPTRSRPERHPCPDPERELPGCSSDPERGGGGGTGGSSDWSCNSSDHEDASSAGRSRGAGRSPKMLKKELRQIVGLCLLKPTSSLRYTAVIHGGAIDIAV